jgi:uncharacterized protein YyaL (SSP411 family)
MSNHLAGETSPYLQQHADNPVDWYPWGSEALSRAQNEDKPVLLSIGYSACHWCHVMAHECFEDDEIARFMNENFINIKVDREERPDIDSIYMKAVQAITGSGGWPLTVFLTPDGKPFFGGTYFPPEDMGGLPAFPRVLKSVADAYRNRRSEVERVIGQIVTALTTQSGTRDVSEPLVPDMLRQAYLSLAAVFDSENGGFGSAPKFPQPMALEFLLRYFHRIQDERALKMVEVTLEKMAKGGIYDQIGGGFHRYATDSIWLVPHFEKMLYDNALLSRIYLYAYLVTGNELFRSVVEGTLDYVLREMTAPNGAFYSTQDADSEGVEGRYYLWTHQEINELVGRENSRLITDYFGVTPAGNFEGRNVLHVAGEPGPKAAGIINRAKKSLLAKRQERVRPARDDKTLTSWNGLMLASLTEAACALGRPDYLAAAVANGSFILESMLDGGTLQHTYKDGVAKFNGYLDDYAATIDGMLNLHQATFRGEWLRQAIALARTMVAQFWNETAGAFYDTGEKHENLFVRPQNTSDGAVPSGASMSTLMLLKLAALTGENQFERIAVRALLSVREHMLQYPLGFGNWLCALDFYLSEPRQIAIIGSFNNPATAEILHTLCATWLPNKVVAARDSDDPTSLSELKLFENRGMIDNRPTVYVCHGYSCRVPVTDGVSLKEQLLDN